MNVFFVTSSMIKLKEAKELLTSKVIITDMHCWMDGGTTDLICENISNKKFEIKFVQNVIWEVPVSYNIPGRIYLNEKLVKQRSKIEELIINCVENCELLHPNELDQKIINEYLDYVKSEQYLINARKVKITND